MSPRDPKALFLSLSEEFRRYLFEQRSQVDREFLVFPASQGDRLGQALFSRLTSGGFCTLVVTGRRDWDPRSHYHQAARFAARRGCKIHRSFLLPHRHCRHDPTLREHIRLDREAGIEIEVVYVGEVLSQLTLPLAESLEFGLWDEAVACIGVFGQEGAAGSVAEWRVTARPEDLQTLIDIRKILSEQAERLDDEHAGTDAPDLEEPMITTAPIARELAPILCRGDHVSPDDCSWYHTVWQYLRIFDMVSTPTWHQDFYKNAFDEVLAGVDVSRVLISGTADYSMLAHVLWACERAGLSPAVTVLDLCETPLFLCKWYGKMVGAQVQTVVKDLLTFEDRDRFDLIATDAFLTRFSASDQGKVIRRWGMLLKPGGRVVTTVRIEPGLTKPSVLATPDQADSFRRRAIQEARRWQGFLRCAPEEIANLAQRYAERMVSFSLGSEESVRSLFKDAGFSVTRLELAEVPGEMASTIYAEIVAELDG